MVMPVAARDAHADGGGVFEGISARGVRAPAWGGATRARCRREGRVVSWRGPDAGPHRQAAREAARADLCRGRV